MKPEVTFAASLSAALTLFCGIAWAAEVTDRIEHTDVFVAGENGYHTHRIPSVILTSKGTLLAFAEARKGGSSDTGNIDLVLKRSVDGGRTWSPMEIVWDDADNTCGNPCPVVDRSSGTIWLLVTHNLGVDREQAIVDGTSQGSRTCWVSRSTDDGRTWLPPVEITRDVKRSDWTWYATGPGTGIQLRNGRLLIPCDHKVAVTKARQSHVIYSDDHGASWKIGGVVGPNCNESQAVELEDGSVMLNIRSYQANNRRMVSISNDGGLTFTAPVEDTTLIEPVCQASILRLSRSNNGGTSRILFSNPASSKREKMTIRLSYDEGKSWPIAKQLHGGPSAYSCLTALAHDTIGCLYERGDKSPYEKIVFARMSLEQLTDGMDKGHVQK